MISCGTSRRVDGSIGCGLSGSNVKYCSGTGRPFEHAFIMQNVGTHLPYQGHTRRRFSNCRKAENQKRTKLMCNAYAILHWLFQAMAFLNWWQFNVNVITLCALLSSFHFVNIFVCQHYVCWYTFAPAPFSLKCLVVHIYTRAISSPNPIFSKFA